MSFYFGSLPKFSQQRKTDHQYHDARTNRTVMTFDTYGISTFFTAPRPVFRSKVEKLKHEEFKARQTYLTPSWIQIDSVCDEIDICRQIMSKYDYVDKHETGEECNCRHDASTKDNLPYWLLLRERALTQIGCGYTLYQMSLELQQAIQDQIYQEKLVDYTTDSLQHEIMSLKQQVASLHTALKASEAKFGMFNSSTSSSSFYATQFYDVGRPISQPSSPQLSISPILPFSPISPIPIDVFLQQPELLSFSDLQ